MDVDEDSAQIRDVWRLDQDVILATPTDDAADVESWELRQVRPWRVTEFHPLQGLDDLSHLLDGVHRVVEATNVAGDTVRMNGHVHDAGVHGNQIIRTERLCRPPPCPSVSRSP